MRFPRHPLRRRRPSTATHEVDCDRDALEAVALAELILDPVRVVTRDQGRIVDEEAEARRAHGHLRAVEEVQPPVVARRRLAALSQLAEEAIQLTGGNPCRVFFELLLDPVEQPCNAAAGLCGEGDHWGPLAEPRLEARAHLFELRL